MAVIDWMAPMPPRPSAWNVSVSSPFLAVAHKGALTWLRLLPHAQDMTLELLELVEALLYPSDDFPKRRTSKETRSCVVLLDHMNVRSRFRVVYRLLLVKIQ